MRRARPLLLLVLAGLLGGCSVGDDDGSDGTSAAGQAVPAAATTTGGGGAGGTATDTGAAGGAAPAGSVGGSAVPDLVERVMPSVVAVRVRTAQGRGEGSGVIVDPDGVIVTNNHVVEGGQEVNVVYASHRTVPAEIVATDPRTDLAVLRVRDRDLPAARLREGLPRVGEFAMALGNPQGLEGSVTVGVVSGLGRSIPGAADPSLVDLIQTDAAISPGNSGGALVDGEGNIVGINVAYLPPQAGAVSLGFAIPAPTARSVIDQLLENGRVRHPYLGVTPADLTPEIAQQFGIEAESGVLVVQVEQGGPAARAGLQVGDVVVRAGDDDLESVGDLFAALRDAGVGQDLPLTVIREGRRTDVQVTPTERPSGE